MDEVKTEEKPKEVSIVEEAKQLSELLEKQKNEIKELLKQEEQMAAKKILSGKAEAGIAPVVVDKETEIKNRVNKYLEGTGLKI